MLDYSSKYQVATTVLLTNHATPTDEKILEMFDHQTRFCIIPDHYHTSPTGFPNQKKLLTEKYSLAERLMQDRPDVIFLTTYWHERLNQYHNVHYFNGCLLHDIRLLKKRSFSVEKNSKPKTAMVIGGKERVNRILSSHWLAKNYPLDQLIVHGRQTDNLDAIIDIISLSPYFSKKHIRKNLYLQDNWIPRNKITSTETPNNPSNTDVFINHLLPNFFQNSFLSFVPDTMNIELGNLITEKTLYAMASKSLILWLGTFQASPLLKRMGFEVFESAFNLDHLDIEDRYGCTIMGFENNKDTITSHEHIEHLWHDHKHELQHNFEMVCVNDDIEKFFSESEALAIEACNHIDFSSEQITYSPEYLKNIMYIL